MEVITVKFKSNSKLYNFSPKGIAVKVGDKVVINSSSGKTIATVVKENFKLKPEELVAPLESIERLATAADIKLIDKMEERREDVLQTTRQLITKYNLDMKLVDVEFPLDGQKIIITYVCEDRVDFRQLVKDLAGKLKSRIELRQIGIRDQAKIVGGLGACGQLCCCKRYLNNFDKVSIKMAKTQNLSLNPTKISGICGRLMCCLGYENEHYVQTQKIMPKINSRVNTPDGSGSVVYNNLLKQLVEVRLDGDDYVVKKYALSDIKLDKKNDESANINSHNNMQSNKRTNFNKNKKSQQNKNDDNQTKNKATAETKTSAKESVAVKERVDYKKNNKVVDLDKLDKSDNKKVKTNKYKQKRQ